MAPPDGDGAPAPDVWGALARTYRFQEPLERRSTLALLRVLAPTGGETVVDVGSGVGKVPRALALSRRGRTAALEPSPRMLAAGRYAGASVVRADGTRLPLADGSVDVVVAAWVLHVLTPDQRAAAVAEIARVLRPGGRLGVIVSAVPATAGRRVVRSVAHALARRLGVHAFEVPADLPALLTDHGLQVRHHARTARGYLADVVVCTRARTPA
jgi:ubiquinone/menaquinone biosynthesis C-methylase UbiE